jgi:hypothetical protein
MTDDEFRWELLRVLTGFAESADSMVQTGEEAHKTLDLLMRWVAKSVQEQRAAYERLGRIELHLAELAKGVEGRKAETGGCRVGRVGRGVGSRDPDNGCVEEG